MSIILRNGQPAIEVKDHELYLLNWHYIELSRGLDVATVNALYESVLEDFWRLFAPEIAKEFGYGDVIAEGRSNGWLTVSNPPLFDDPAYDEPVQIKKGQIERQEWEEFESRIDQLIVENRTRFYEMLEEEITNREAEAIEAAEMAARGVETV